VLFTSVLLVSYVSIIFFFSSLRLGTKRPTLVTVAECAVFNCVIANHFLLCIAVHTVHFGMNFRWVLH